MLSRAMHTYIIYLCRIRPGYTVSQAEPTATRSLRKKPPLASHDPHSASHDPRRIPTNLAPVMIRYPDSMTLPSLVSNHILSNLFSIIYCEMNG